MKRMLLVVMSLVMILGLCSFAPPDDPVSPDYLYTSRCSSLLSISGLNATCTSNLIGYYGETTNMYKMYINVSLCPPAYYYYTTLNFGGVFYGYNN